MVDNAGLKRMRRDGNRRRRGDPRRSLARGVDRLNRGLGRLAGWLVLAMVLLGAFNAIARYLGRFVGVNLSSNAYLELQWYLFSLVFLLGGAYTLLKDDHVRVDVLYGRLSARGRMLVDLAGTLVLLVPFALFVLWVSWPAVRNSWAVLEGSPDPGGLPRYPIRTMILVGFALLLLHGLGRLPRSFAEWRGVRLEEDPGRAPDERPPGRGAA